MTLLCYRMTINTSKASTTLKIFSRLLSVISRWSHSFSSIQSVVHRIQNTFKRNKSTPRKGLWSKYKYRVFRSNYIPIHFCPHLRFTSGIFVLLQYFIVDNYCSIYFVFFSVTVEHIISPKMHCSRWDSITGPLAMYASALPNELQEISTNL